MKSFFRNFSPGLVLALAVIVAMIAVFTVLTVAVPLGVALTLVLISAGLVLLTLHLGGIARVESVVNHNIAMTDSRRRGSTHYGGSVIGAMFNTLAWARDSVHGATAS